ncbi:amino acid permease/ SLC12A domain-containing protein [Aspergillus karnatakaensis]|uniref:amino acid permease/ SLC12A domain-containing protein n=1 Tax=Aspergillus karnatakaensis TaxID=1810916 RepID=UPI003CCCF2BE
MSLILPDPHEPKKEAFDANQQADSIVVEVSRNIPSTQRGLSARHALFIAWGGTVGTGLFITTGKTLATGGPAFLVGSYIFVSILVYFILTGVIEIATFLPVRGGSMSWYGRRFVSNSLGFAMGWLYVYSYAVLVPFELTACAILSDFWQPGVNSAVWITILLVLLVALNVLPVRFYGEAEFIFTGVKLATITGLLFLSFILFWGGGPRRDRLGFRYWEDPGATNTLILAGDIGRFVAAIATVISSILPFTFTPEMVVGTAAEIKDPKRNIPRVAKHFTWRLVVLFVGSVAGIRMAGIHGLDSVINAVALIAAWSTGNAFLYLSSRSLHSMAIEGSAPGIFKRCTAKGVPIYAVGATACVSLLSYLTLNSSSAEILNWLLNLVNTGGFLSWVCCSITYLRFRRACEVQGVSGEQLAPRSMLQPYSSWITLVLFSVFVFLNGFTVFFPSHWAIADFVSAYIGLPAFFALYFGHRLLYRGEPWVIPAHLVDLTPGVPELDTLEV